MIDVVSIQIPQLYSSLCITAGTCLMEGDVNPWERYMVVP